MSINLTFIKPKNTLKLAAHKSDLITSIVAKVKEIENYSGLKFDNELLIFVCNCIENALTGKIDKKTLCLEIFDQLFALTLAEKNIISCSVDFVCNNKLVKTIPLFQKYLRIITNYLKSKL